MIICKKHGLFFQKASSHKKGSGCQKCGQEKGIAYNSRNQYKDKPTTLYYIKIKTNTTVYKIGLTVKSVEERFYKELRDGLQIETIKTWAFDDGIIAFDKEQQIIKENQHSKYNGKSILYKGNTELFTQDVLNLSY